MRRPCRDLEDIVALTGPCDPGRVIHVLRQACGALEEAHACGLLHNDIKPSNIYLCPKRGPADVVKLLDFGLVKDLRGATSVERTQANMLLGTPQYMSPEAISDPPRVDARSDIYALGAVAYYLLAGRSVFGGRNVVEVCDQHLYTAPAPIPAHAGRPMPRDLAAVVLRCLEKNPDARYSNARALREALDGCHHAHAWTEQDASSWWSNHGGALTVGAVLDASNAPPTIAIDLHARPVRIPAREGLDGTVMEVAGPS